LRNSLFYDGGSFKLGELNNGIIDYESKKKITNCIKKSSLRLNKLGDVLIAMYIIGKTAIVNIEGTTNQAVCACTPFLVSSTYLHFTSERLKDTFINQRRKVGHNQIFQR
jgi:type I restriction enzyme S subunit